MNVDRFKRSSLKGDAGEPAGRDCPRSLARDFSSRCKPQCILRARRAGHTRRSTGHAKLVCHTIEGFSLYIISRLRCMLERRFGFEILRDGFLQCESADSSSRSRRSGSSLVRARPKPVAAQLSARRRKRPLLRRRLPAAASHTWRGCGHLLRRLPSP